MIESSDLSVKDILTALDDEKGLKNYENLLYKLSHKDLDDDELLRLIKEVKQCIPLIRITYNTLIEAMLNIKWLKRNDEIILEFHSFVIDLLAARQEFLGFVLNKLISCFIPFEG